MHGKLLFRANYYFVIRYRVFCNRHISGPRTNSVSASNESRIEEFRENESKGVLTAFTVRVICPSILQLEMLYARR